MLLDREETKEFLQKISGEDCSYCTEFCCLCYWNLFSGLLYPSVLMLFATCTLFAGEKKVPMRIRVAYAVVLGIAVTYAFQSVFPCRCLRAYCLSDEGEGDGDMEILAALSAIVNPMCLLYLIFGTVAGIVLGAIPGLSGGTGAGDYAPADI